MREQKIMDKTMDWFKLIKDTYFLKDKAGEEIYGKKLLEFLEKKSQFLHWGQMRENGTNCLI